MCGGGVGGGGGGDGHHLCKTKSDKNSTYMVFGFHCEVDLDINLPKQKLGLKKKKN